MFQMSKLVASNTSAPVGAVITAQAVAQAAELHVMLSKNMGSCGSIPISWWVQYARKESELNQKKKQ